MKDSPAGLATVLTENFIGESQKSFEDLAFSILESVPHAILGFKERAVLFANNSVEVVFGRKPEELIGRNARVLYRTDDEYEKIADLFYSVLENQQFFTKEFTCRHKDGKDILCRVRAARVGTELYDKMIVATYEDITEFRRAEKLIVENAKALERSNRDLQDFAYVASHDLQEPLRMVTGFVQLLSQRYKDKLDSDANDFINYAVDGSKRMLLLINDLLAYSRVGTEAKDFESTDCNALFDTVSDNLRWLIEENKAVVTHDCLPTVNVDYIQLAQVLQNLISNSIKYCSNELPRIHVSASLAGKKWVFSVKDNGIGIDPKFNDRIFKIFQRLQKAGKGSSGTGIGLAICKKVIERHGGRIWVESEVNKGAIFYFTIPEN